MSAFFLSLALIFVAELGDKSQLVALWFATRHKWWLVLAGVTVATLIVHLGSGRHFKSHPALRHEVNVNGTRRLLDFGVHPAVAAGPVSATLAGTLQIACSGRTALGMAVDGGLHQSGAQRHLRGGAGALVAYRLYADAGRTQPIAIGQPVSVAVPGLPTLPLHGELTLPAGQAPPDAYTDTAQVTLTY